MTLEELKAEAKRQGYRLQKIPDYDCSCYMPYPNERHRHRNGKWKCVDRYEPANLFCANALGGDDFTNDVDTIEWGTLEHGVQERVCFVKDIQPEPETEPEE